MKSRYLQTTIRIGLSLVFLYILSRLIDLQLLKEALHQVRPDLVCLAIGVYLCNIAIRAYRLQIILNRHTKRLVFKDAYMITLVGIALNILVPATLGDIARSYYGYKIYGIKEEMFSTTVVDKLFAFCALFLLGAVSSYMMHYVFLCLVSLGAAVVTFLPLTFPTLIPWHLVDMLFRRFKKSLDREKLLTVFDLPVMLKMFVLGISLAGWLWTCFYFYILCSAFPVTVSLGYIILIMPILIIIRLFPFTINALGPMEVAVAYFFSLIGINTTLAVLISLVSNVISSIIPGLLGFLIIVVFGHRNRKEPYGTH